MNDPRSIQYLALDDTRCIVIEPEVLGVLERFFQTLYPKESRTREMRFYINNGIRAKRTVEAADWQSYYNSYLEEADMRLTKIDFQRIDALLKDEKVMAYAIKHLYPYADPGKLLKSLAFIANDVDVFWGWTKRIHPESLKTMIQEYPTGPVELDMEYSHAQVFTGTDPIVSTNLSDISIAQIYNWFIRSKINHFMHVFMLDVGTTLIGNLSFTADDTERPGSTVDIICKCVTDKKSIVRACIKHHIPFERYLPRRHEQDIHVLEFTIAPGHYNSGDVLFYAITDINLELLTPGVNKPCNPHYADLLRQVSQSIGSRIGHHRRFLKPLDSLHEQSK